MKHINVINLVFKEHHFQVQFEKPFDKHLFMVTDEGSMIKILRQNLSCFMVEKKEIFLIILINEKNQIIGVHNLPLSHYRSPNNINLIGRLALITNARAMFFVSNHPGIGNIMIPSPLEIRLTKELKVKLDSIGILLLNHILIDNKSYLPMFENRL